MTFTIEPTIIVSGEFCSLVRWNNDLNAKRQKIVNKIRSSIASVSNDRLECQAIDQRLGLGAIMALSSGQSQAQRIAQPIDSNMDFAAKSAATAPQRLFTTFFVRLLHMDGHAQSCYPASRFPYPGHQQNSSTFSPKRPFYTSARSVYRHCSIARTPLAVIAIVLRCGLSISPLPQTVGSFAHLSRHRHSPLVAKSSVSLPIVRH
jgi:hypothetical protein